MGTSLIEGTPSNSPREPTGVAGWLFFYIACAIVLWPTSCIVSDWGHFSYLDRTHPEYSTHISWSAYKLATLSLDIVRATLSIVSGFLLANRFSPSSVTFTKWQLWIGGALFSVIHGFVFVPYLFGVRMTPDAIEYSAGQLISVLVPVVAWHLYFARSKRVRNTYYPS